MIYDIEFFYEGGWRFHNQETDPAKAESWADWLRNRLKVEARVTEREGR
jgi:hypothetical protein